MPDDGLLEPAIALGMLQMFPPDIRLSVLKDEAFRRRVALVLDAEVRLDPSGVTFRRSKLFGAIRNFLSLKVPEVHVSSEDGVAWRLDLTETGEDICLVRDDVEIGLPDFMCLLPDSTKRVDWFDREVRKYDLVDESTKTWREKLNAGIVEDEDVDQLLLELHLSPLWVAQSVLNELRKPSIDILRLVPSDIRYYDRLVGTYSGEAKLAEFVIKSASPRI